MRRQYGQNRALTWSLAPGEEVGREKRFSEEQIIGFLKEAEGGVLVKEPCRKHGILRR